MKNKLQIVTAFAFVPFFMAFSQNVSDGLNYSSNSPTKIFFHEVAISNEIRDADTEFEEIEVTVCYICLQEFR